MNVHPGSTDDTDPRLETLRPTARAHRGPDAPVPALTVLVHPNLLRVGEVARPMRLRLGAPLPLCRLEPAFEAADGAARPLETPFVSRRPVTLVPRDDGMELRPAEGIPLVRMNGRPLTEAVRLSQAELDLGVVLEMGTEVALLLHHLPPRDADGAPDPDLGLLGRSPAMCRLRRVIQAAASPTGPVLILGETGTGKERVAHAIHDLGPRREGPFVSVNMAAVTASVAQSALFGHARGAFTGAEGRHPGYFQQASGGTLFLDEIGAASDDLQAHLLRVLETGEVQRLGGTRSEQVDVRVLAATDVALGEAVSEGRFRRALFHRLAAFVVQVPPLRQRRDDIPRLFVAFLGRELEAAGLRWPPSVPAPGGAGLLGAAFMRRLTLHDWPGNVRELQNVARQTAAALQTDDDLEAVLDGLEALDALPQRRPSDTAIGGGHVGGEQEAPNGNSASLTSEDVREALEANWWRPGAAARQLGVSRATLYRMMDQDPSIRAAKDVPEEELRRSWQDCGGDVRAMAEHLRVSERGLVLRLGQLGWSQERPRG